MKLKLHTTKLDKHVTDCLILGVFDQHKLSPSAAAVNKASKNVLTQVLKNGDLTGDLGKTLLLQAVPHLKANRVLLVNCGDPKKLDAWAFQRIVKATINKLKHTNCNDATFCLAELDCENQTLEWKLRKLGEWLTGSTYEFSQYKSTTKKKATLKQSLIVVKSQDKKYTRALNEGQATANGIMLTKRLGDTPPNVCTPVYLEKEAKQLQKAYPSIKASALDEKQIKAAKMGAFYSVAQGSKNPPRLITLNYKGGKPKQKPIVLVGKGITFDTGGNSLKPPPNMIGMKYDMCGAATVFGVVRAAAELKLPLNIVGVIAAAENMPGNSASRPEDIVTTMSGKTVEILNTDAEGRLVLCDALTYSKRFKPDVVIDMATLTGACVVALSYHASAVMGNDESLQQDLLKAGFTSLDRCWQLPLWDEYQKTLSSKFADIANIANPPYAGTITAGCFLSRFTEDYKWAHLDIAGTASQATGPERGATGRPVGLLVQYLLDRISA